MLKKDGDVDIKDTSTSYIEWVQAEYFCHRDQCNFHRNYRNFASALALEAEYSSARRRNGGDCYSFFLFILFHVHSNAPPPPSSKKIYAETYEEGGAALQQPGGGRLQDSQSPQHPQQPG